MQVNHVLSVVHRVNELAKIELLLTQVLEFSLTQQADSFLVLSNGALTIRLVLEAEPISYPSFLSLDICTTDLDNAGQFYCQQGFKQIKQACWVHPLRQEIQLSALDSIHLTVYRDYNEDDLNILADLVVSLDWQSDALKITQSLLKSVPISFREQARLRVVEMAESEAIIQGLMTVDQPLAIQTMIRSTPDFQLEQLKQEMLKHDLSIEDYFTND